MSKLTSIVGAVWRDAVGLAGLVLTCAGVYQLAGPGWTLIAAGVPLFAGYAIGELRAPATRRKE